MSKFRAIGGVAALLTLLALPAVAQDEGDAAAGRQLAAKWCDSCHVVGSEQSRAASTGAPPFAVIARDKAVTPMGVRVFLQTPHDRMPDLHLDRNEIDDLTTYIFSLRH